MSTTRTDSCSVPPGQGVLLPPCLSCSPGLSIMKRRGPRTSGHVRTLEARSLLSKLSNPSLSKRPHTPTPNKSISLSALAVIKCKDHGLGTTPCCSSTGIIYRDTAELLCLQHPPPTPGAFSPAPTADSVQQRRICLLRVPGQTIFALWHTESKSGPRLPSRQVPQEPVLVILPLPSV